MTFIGKNVGARYELGMADIGKDYEPFFALGPVMHCREAEIAVKPQAAGKCHCGFTGKRQRLLCRAVATSALQPLLLSIWVSSYAACGRSG
jgi:hypothetical protein